MIDDLQWADRKSVEALTFMLRRLSVDPVVAIVIYRGPGGGLDEPGRRQASQPAHRRPVSTGVRSGVVSYRARSRAAATRSRMLTTPGRTRRDENRYSHASRNSSFGESCSIARANRNSSRSFQRGS